MKFYTGEPVQFTSRNGKTYKGVISKVGSPKTRYLVACGGTENFRVPEQMLSPCSEIKKDELNRLNAAGDAFQSKRNEHKDNHEQRMIRICQSHIESYRLKAGDNVKYVGAVGWPEVVILDVLADEGKVVISNWKGALRDKLVYFGINDLGRLRNARDKVTVWANRVKTV
jgi:hypothetical protein